MIPKETIVALQRELLEDLKDFSKQIHKSKETVIKLRCSGRNDVADAIQGEEVNQAVLLGRKSTLLNCIDKLNKILT